MQRTTGVPLDLATAPPAYRRDYVRIAAWLFAVLFGPALIALIVILTTRP